MDLQNFTIGFADQFEDADREKITIITSFKDLDGWDSLTTMLIIGYLKTEWDKDITAAQLKELDTVEDVFNFIKS